MTPTDLAMRGFRSVILDGHGVEGVTTLVAILVAMSAGFALVARRWSRFDQAKVGRV